MYKKVLKTIKEKNLINKNDSVIVGVSGGPDSMFLLSILYEIQKIEDFNIIVCHVNHGVRGIESDQDEEFVKNTCKDLNIPFYSIKVDMDQYAKENNLTSEEAGRELRYRFFRKTLAKYGKGSIAVAHNRNDQAETLLMRFIRGTGIDGLKGMDYKNNDIIRPVLDIARDDIEKYIEDNKISVRIDKTNKMDIYRRNSIRLNLIPMIEKDYNPSIIDTLYRTSWIMERDSNFINDYTNDIFRNIVKITSNNVQINTKDLMKIHKAIQYRLIRLSIEQVIGHLKGVEEVHIQSIINIATNNTTGKKITISNNVEAYISYDKLILQTKKEKDISKIDSILDLNNSNYISELDLDIRFEIIENNIENIKSKDMFIKYFDYDKIEGDLFIKNRESGDRFKPLGMKGTKKLKDYFIDEKIPRDERDSTPLIYDKHGILWVVGHRISEDYKIDKSTKKVLKISINK
ncbi:tRNA lysidine(34) synthetase TilS [Clostridium sp. D2Q-11]|uniref:tRNA(Ile)-lysidine synthase n=1 Tax=Anaeromonas frigoriresistens TaxID=2683708 RepID=A0A942Z6H1_9FIRM|nr:tRNA lysidine(34) synthetase TilS [Anaeromonas frigoriresistens]MBS4537577.1 tRNA lysidine(34) synthetase TilS [Anaeromonas frigoriresistens]